MGNEFINSITMSIFTLAKLNKVIFTKKELNSDIVRITYNVSFFVRNHFKYVPRAVDWTQVSFYQTLFPYILQEVFEYKSATNMCPNIFTYYVFSHTGIADKNEVFKPLGFGVEKMNFFLSETLFLESTLYNVTRVSLLIRK